TISSDQKFTGYVGEMLLIFRPTQAADQLHIVRDVIVGLAKCGVGIQRVGILIEEVVVPLVVQMLEIIRVDILARNASLHVNLRIVEGVRISQTSHKAV